MYIKFLNAYFDVLNVMLNYVDANYGIGTGHLVFIGACLLLAAMHFVVLCPVYLVLKSMVIRTYDNIQEHNKAKCMKRIEETRERKRKERELKNEE